MSLSLLTTNFRRRPTLHKEDWLRLGWFSGKHIQELEFIKDKIDSTEPCMSYFCLRQILLNKNLHRPPIHSEKISFNLNSNFKVPLSSRIYSQLSNIIYEKNMPKCPT